MRFMLYWFIYGMSVIITICGISFFAFLVMCFVYDIVKGMFDN